MKKILLSSSLILNLRAGNAFAMISGDMSEYVRRDVLEARDSALIAEIRLGNEKILREIDSVRREMDKRFNEMHSEMDSRFKEMDKRFNEMHSEMDSRFKKVDKRFNEMHSETDSRFKEVDKRFNKLETEIAILSERTDSTKTVVYWGLGFLGLIIVFAPDILERIRRVRTPTIPLNELERTIERIITEKLNGRFSQLNQ